MTTQRARMNIPLLVLMRLVVMDAHRLTNRAEMPPARGLVRTTHKAATGFGTTKNSKRDDDADRADRESLLRRVQGGGGGEASRGGVESSGGPGRGSRFGPKFKGGYNR